MARPMPDPAPVRILFEEVQVNIEGSEDFDKVE